HPAVLLGEREPEQAELPEALHDLVREPVGGLVLGGARDDLAVHELAHREQHVLLVGGEAERRIVGRRHQPSLGVRVIPAARPAASTSSAILRLASSIISPLNMTAPRPSSSVATRYASRIATARSNCFWAGE